MSYLAMKSTASQYCVDENDSTFGKITKDKQMEKYATFLDGRRDDNKKDVNAPQFN